ncbi:restriction endonuclease subunit S [Mesorhizobium sp.]|uniref:restriction endonuclease subunit S n=1 Tax=Mesorhizobium sp. TaxID=1871066 RepID=UPI0012292B94|nr:restriction endonuclease subunit S [Mesorhizobium sp.]TIS97879.1 MAG: restriction endonuclease subunit S [Mesorhizobium sp.]
MSAELVQLGDAVREDGGILQTGPFGSQLKQAEYSAEGVPVIMPKDIHNGEISTESVARVPEVTADRLVRHRVAANGIVLPRRGEVTKRAFIGEQQAGWLCGTGCLKIETRGNLIWPKYLYYYMGTPGSVEWLERNAVGSTMLNLSAEIVSRFPIRLPDINAQKDIADILSAYDDLIENNRRRITLLEETARMLYREWFVHFRFPGHEHVKIIDGIPGGWETQSTSVAFEINPTTPRNDDGEILCVPMAALSETAMTVDRSPFELRLKSTNVRFRNSDTLFARITPCLENGKTGFVYFLQDNEVACGSTEFIVLRGRTVSPYFVYLTARMDSFRQNAIKSMIGSSGRQRVQNSCFDRYRLAVPPKLLASIFDDSVGPMFEQISKLDQANQKLAQARDLLLPRLMSGEIAV